MQTIEIPGQGPVDFPDEMTDEQIAAVLSSQFPKPQPAAVTVGATIRDIPRQLGLTARYGIEGLSQIADIGTEPIRAIMEAAGAPQTGSTSQGVSSLLDSAGFPKPEGPNERVIGDASRMLAGGGGMLGGAARVAGLPGLLGRTGAAFSQAPALQGISAGSAGVAGGSVREAGGSPIEQAGASLLAGVAAPLSANALSRAGRTGWSLLRPPTPQMVDSQIELTLRSQGVDWSGLSAGVQQRLRNEATAALRGGGELDAEAMRRLTDFARVPGSTPTRGLLTLNPVQITREKNLAKTGANSGNEDLQGLALIENRNNRSLIDALNTAGAGESRDAYGTGELLMRAVQGNIDQSRAGINSLYDAAKATSGRTFSLDGRAFADRAIQDLDQNLLGGALPVDVRNHLNAISRGQVPFTVDYAEQLKTLIGNLQRNSSDGSARTALGMVRRAIDDTPPLPQNGSTAAGDDSIAAFNQARTANRQFMQQVENTPAMQAVYEGTATPDHFVKRFIIGDSATADDVTALRAAVQGDPTARTAAQGYIAQYLKEKALNGAADEVGNFSPSAFNKALQAIGTRKLAAFFSAEEIEQLQAIGRVGSYMKHQPTGAAVNNSNSAAMLAGGGLDILDALAKRTKLLGIGPQVQVATRGLLQRDAQNIRPAIVNRPLQPTARGLLAPSAMYSGLLAASPANRREDDRSR